MTDREEEKKIELQRIRHRMRILKSLDLKSLWLLELQRYCDLLGQVKIRKVTDDTHEI